MLGLGRLGGKTDPRLRPRSVYLYGRPAGESDGEDLDATFTSSPRPARDCRAQRADGGGALYEVDTRLRPQGNQGPLAVSVESFAKYQRENAWTWEHMALTRARVVAGSRAAREIVHATIAEVLETDRSGDDLREAVLEMRAQMLQHKQPAGPLDAKLVRGGLVDLEFAIHHLQLRDRVALDPRLRVSAVELVERGLLPHNAVEAYDLLTRLLVACRLLAPDLTMPDAPASSVLAGACGCSGPENLLQALRTAREQVAAAWSASLRAELEMGND